MNRRGGSEKSLTVSISRVSPGVLQKNKEDVQTPATGQSWKLSSTAFQSFNLSLWWSLGAWLGKTRPASRQHETRKTWKVAMLPSSNPSSSSP